MKRIPEIALLVLLLVTTTVRPVLCQESAEQHCKQLNAKTATAYQQVEYQQGIAFAEQAYAYALKHFGAEYLYTLTSKPLIWENPMWRPCSCLSTQRPGSSSFSLTSAR